MAEGIPMEASVLGMLADLSPSAPRRSAALTVPLDWFRWLPASAVQLFLPAEGLALDRRGAQLAHGVAVERAFGERLAAIDQIRPGQARSLRVGWLFVAGRRRLGDGRAQRVFHPLLSVPVRVVLPRPMLTAQLWAAGDVAVTDLVADSDRRHELEATYELGGGALDGVRTPEIDEALLHRLHRLRSFAAEAAAAADFEPQGLVPAMAGPEQLLRETGLTVVAGVGVYTAHDLGGLSAASSLRAWAGRPLPGPTAFSSLYLGGCPEVDEPAITPPTSVLAPFPLTPTQQRAVAASRTAAVSVVSGAPGTGKSHTVSAIACDAVGRGETVLVAAKSDAAVDALLVLLHEAPGPDPVVFGSSERRDRLATRLASGELHPANRAELAAAEAAVQEAAAARRQVVAGIADRLRIEAHLQGDDRPVDDARVVAPALFDPGCDLAQVGHLLDVVAGCGPGWWARRRARRAWARAVTLAGAGPDTAVPALVDAAARARLARGSGDLVAAGGLDLAQDWARLEDLEAQVPHLVGRWLALVSRSPARLDRPSLAEVAVLGTALRSGRAARREQLSRLDHRLTRALPLWVGTLGDVEDLLPPTADLFDLVILDEASAIDQPLAAPALLRARRVVVVGDPHQLRHVSFLADDQLRQAAEDNGLGDDPLLVGRLDVRRNSIFDVAVASAPATTLDEHFRSAPHLVDFVARRLYGGHFTVATRSPATEGCDCIDVVRLRGRRDDGVVRAEVDEVVARLHELVRTGARSVGVITPFRAQSDALEEAVLAAFSVADLEALALRVGTVHAFQGNERDVVLVSVGIGEGDGPATWRFVEDSHLFAVLATRARRRLVLLLSADPPRGGLMADYLAQADTPPGRPRPTGVPSHWTGVVAGDLDAAGIANAPLYPCGRHTVDVCAGGAARFVGLECRVHPDGPAAHVERHLALRRAGWELADAFQSRWAERRGWSSSSPSAWASGHGESRRGGSRRISRRQEQAEAGARARPPTPEIPGDARVCHRLTGRDLAREALLSTVQPVSAEANQPSRRRLLVAGLGVAAAACGASRRGSSGGGAAGVTTTPAMTPSTPPVPAGPGSSPPESPAAGTPARFVQHGPAASGAVALTFHVAGDPAAARRLFDEAARLHVPVTLFLVGTFVTANPAYIAELARAGHEVANHTATHPTLGRLGAAAVATEVRGCRDALVAATGQAGRWFRPSGMDVATPLVLEQAGRAGYSTVVGYDLDPHDYQDPGAAAVVDRVRAGLHPGAIVSLHSAHPGTVTALPEVVAAARSAGLRLVTVGDLLGTT